MEAMNLVEVVLNNETEDENIEMGTDSTAAPKSSPIKGLDESVTITVTRTPGRPNNTERKSGKPANFALLSPGKNGRNADAIRTSPREEMVCNGCERVFKYRAAFIRHEAQCGLPVALRMERAAILEAKKAMEKAAEIEKRKIVEKLPELRCPTCLKQFTDNDSFKSHDFDACAAERATYTFVCSVCKARFKYKNHMRRHEDSHNNVRRYNCEVCTTAFLRPDHLKRHMMRMHGIVQLPIQSTPEKPVSNPSPGPRAVLSSDEKETRTITKNAPMQCPMCSKVLSRRDHVLRHMRNVHHIVYGTRNRGRVPQEASQIPGLEIDGLMDLEGNNSCKDDEDGSENQSMASHDELYIDESFESIKRECESPISDNCNEAMMNSSKDNSQGHIYIKSEEELSRQMSSKPARYSFDQSIESMYMKSEPHSPGTAQEYACKNGDSLSHNGSATITGAVSTKADSNCSSSTTNYRPILKTEPDLLAKTIYKRSSDGNQNVLPNGHAARNAGEDWISDLVNLRSWH